MKKLTPNTSKNYLTLGSGENEGYLSTQPGTMTSDLTFSGETHLIRDEDNDKPRISMRKYTDVSDDLNYQRELEDSIGELDQF